MKYAIFRNNSGLYARRYVDDVSELKYFPYIREDRLPVLINRVGGYCSFAGEHEDNFVEIIEVSKGCMPLTREEMFPKNSPVFYYGWISPSGDTYACDFEDHRECAECLVKELMPEKHVLNAERELENMGWIKISRPVPYIPDNIDKQAVYFGNISKRITKAQIKTLFDLGFSEDYNVKSMIAFCYE